MYESEEVVDIFRRELKDANETVDFQKHVISLLLRYFDDDKKKELEQHLLSILNLGRKSDVDKFYYIMDAIDN